MNLLGLGKSRVSLVGRRDDKVAFIRIMSVTLENIMYTDFKREDMAIFLESFFLVSYFLFLLYFTFIEDLDNFLTTLEKQKVVLKGIESIRADASETHIPGYKHALYPGKSISEFNCLSHS